MAGIEDWYSNNPNVRIITNLDDITTPTCEDWGDRHGDFNSIPLMTDDGSNRILWGWFNSNAFPSTVYIDHEMKVVFKATSPSASVAISTIDNMLDECGSNCILSEPMALFEYEISDDRVLFNDLSFEINNGWIISEWLWDFGDGITSDQQNPIHSYNQDGNYTVSLIITTSTGQESEAYLENIQINSLHSDNNQIPNQIEINQNYPNPFNPSTQIDYILSNSGLVNISVYDIYGNIINHISNDYKSSGHHSFKWSPNNLHSGIYFVSITQNQISEKIKVIYMK